MVCLTGLNVILIEQAGNSEHQGAFDQPFLCPVGCPVPRGDSCLHVNRSASVPWAGTWTASGRARGWAFEPSGSASEAATSCSKYKIVSPTKRESFTYFLQSDAFISFSCPISLATVSSTMFSRSRHGTPVFLEYRPRCNIC